MTAALVERLCERAGARVVSADGWPATATQHLLRSLLWPLDVFLPVPAPFGLLGLVVILFQRVVGWSGGRVCAPPRVILM